MFDERFDLAFKITRKGLDFVKEFLGTEAMAKSENWSAYRQIIIETYDGPRRGAHGNRRARPIPGEFYPPTMDVSCSKAMRYAHPVGTKFRIHAREMSREGGPPFLYTGPSWRYQVVE